MKAQDIQLGQVYEYQPTAPAPLRGFRGIPWDDLPPILNGRHCKVHAISLLNGAVVVTFRDNGHRWRTTCENLERIPLRDYTQPPLYRVEDKQGETGRANTVLVFSTNQQTQ